MTRRPRSLPLHGPSREQARVVAAVSAVCGGPIPVAGARTRAITLDHSVPMMSCRGICNPAIIWPPPRLALRDNTLHIIPPPPETRQSGPGYRRSRATRTWSFRSSAAARADRDTVFLQADFTAVVNGAIWGNGLCRSSDTLKGSAANFVIVVTQGAR